MRPLVVAGPMTAAAGAAALVAAFAETAIPQRPSFRRPVHGVAGPADPARLRVLPVTIHGRRSRHPQVVIGADNHRFFGMAGETEWGVAVGAHSQETRRRFRGRPGAANRRPVVRVMTGCAGDSSTRLSSTGIAVERQIRPEILPRAHADRMTALTDRRTGSYLPGGMTDLAGIGTRHGLAPRPLRLHGSNGERLSAVGAVAGSTDPPRPSRPVASGRGTSPRQPPAPRGSRHTDRPARPPTAAGTSSRRSLARRSRGRPRRPGSSGAGRGNQRSRRLYPPSLRPRVTRGENSRQSRRRRQAHPCCGRRHNNPRGRQRRDRPRRARSASSRPPKHRARCGRDRTSSPGSSSDRAGFPRPQPRRHGSRRTDLSRFLSSSHAGIGRPARRDVHHGRWRR